MRRLITSLFIIAVAMLPAAAFAGQIWTDGDGDGLPDGAKFIAEPSAVVSVDIWIDTQSFVFTYFQCWVERQQCLTFQSGQYTITGGTPDVIDTFSNPNATGFTGSGFANLHGVIKVARATFHIDLPGNCCVFPIIEYPNPFGTTSILGAGTAYQLFTTFGRTCWGPPIANEETSWGAIKGLYQ